MKVILHDEEDILGGGEAAVAAFPLLPALRAQLGEVVHQALLLLGGGFGDAEIVAGTGTEVNPESWTQLKGSNEKGI